MQTVTSTYLTPAQARKAFLFNSLILIYFYFLHAVQYGLPKSFKRAVSENFHFSLMIILQ